MCRCLIEKTKSGAYLSVYFCAVTWNCSNMEKHKMNKELMALMMDLVIAMIALYIKISSVPHRDQLDLIIILHKKIN